MMIGQHAKLATAALLGAIFLGDAVTLVGQELSKPLAKDVELALELNERSLMLRESGQDREALPLAERALEIAERVWRVNQYNNHENLATLITNLADLCKDLGPEAGDLPRAEALYRRALAIYAQLRLENPEVARTLNNLAGLYRSKGEFLQAQPLYERALKIRKQSLGMEHRLVADSLDNLGLLFADRSDYARALKYHEQAVEIYRKDPEAATDLAIALRNLALAYTETGDLEQAESLLRETLKTENSNGIRRPGTLNALGRVLRRKGDLDGAEKVYRDALAMFENTPTAINFDLATTLNNLAVLYSTRGDLARAEPRYLSALEMTAKVLGPEHPNVASMLNNLALLYEKEGRAADAVALRKRGNDIREHNLTLLLTTGSEDQKRVYLESLVPETDSTITLNVNSAPLSKDAARLAMTTILQRKGRALDAVADELAALRRRAGPDDIKLLDQLNVARSQLANLTFNALGAVPAAERQTLVTRLAAEADQLEATISLRSAEFRVQSQRITLEGVQQSIPEGAALVEIVSYRPFSARVGTKDWQWGATRYVAYVLRRDGAPVFVSLGPAAPVDEAVHSLRAALAYSGSRNVKPAGRALDRLVMQRVRPLLGGAKHILLSPDGALNLVPFAALVDEHNRYLVENYLITYLTSGRDLLRLSVPIQSEREPLIVANPAFGATISSASPNPIQVKRSSDLRQAKWTELTGTAQEALIIKRLLPHARVLTEGNATEAALKLVAGPSVLHISTHGFFLPDQPKPDPAASLVQELGGPALQITQTESPLLRSGLILAGANQRQSGAGEDGILTALEASALDLRGTNLVVLSACETGVGEVTNGEGVYGLRRALVLAGAASQLMSLWQVDDRATRDLMVKYYEKLTAGKGRSEALRETQLEMLRQRERIHPFYWSSFIPIGDWRSLKLN